MNSWTLTAPVLASLSDDDVADLYPSGECAEAEDEADLYPSGECAEVDDVADLVSLLDTLRTAPIDDDGDVWATSAPTTATRCARFRAATVGAE